MGDTRSGCLCDAADPGAVWMVAPSRFARSAAGQFNLDRWLDKLISTYNDFTHIRSGVIPLQVQLAEIKNKMSEYVRAVQNGSTFEITVRGVPVAMLTPIAKPASKPGFQARVLALMATPGAPKLDVMAALQEGRK